MLRPLGDVDHVSYVITSRIFNLGYSLSCIFQMFVCTSLLLMRNPTLFYHLDFLSYYPLILQFYVHRFPNPPPRVHPHRFQWSFPNRSKVSRLGSTGYDSGNKLRNIPQSLPMIWLRDIDGKKQLRRSGWSVICHLSCREYLFWFWLACWYMQQKLFFTHGMRQIQTKKWF